MKTTNTILALSILLTFNTLSYSQTNSIEVESRKDVVEVLQKFQDGYTNRDTTIIDEFLQMFKQVCFSYPAPLKEVEKQ